MNTSSATDKIHVPHGVNRQLHHFPRAQLSGLWEVVTPNWTYVKTKALLSVISIVAVPVRGSWLLTQAAHYVQGPYRVATGGRPGTATVSTTVLALSRYVFPDSELASTCSEADLTLQSYREKYSLSTHHPKQNPTMSKRPKGRTRHCVLPPSRKLVAGA